MAIQSPITSHPPPDLPGMLDASPALTNYLRTFALWAKNGLAAKLDTGTSSPGHLLQGHDAPKNTIPNVFKFQVNQAGIASLAPVDLGSSPSAVAGVPIFPEAPSGGGSYVRQAGGWVPAVPASGGTFTGAITGVTATFTGLLTAASLSLGGAMTFTVLPTNALNDAAAATAGVAVGGVYRNGSILMVRVA